MNKGPTDTQSVSTTQLTAVRCARATTGQCAVSTSLAPLLRVPTPSHKSVAGPAKVKAETFIETQRILFVIRCKSFHVSLSGCLHEGRERANGETWDDSSDPCGVCVCREGSVQCERKRCPPTNCNHPVQRQCCKSCDGE